MDSWGAFVEDLDARIGHPSLEAFMFKHPPEVAGRTLGYALVFAPSDAGRDCVAREVNACNGDIERLAALAHLYIFGLVRVFKNPKGPTPAITADQSPDVRFSQQTMLHKGSLKAPGEQPASLRQQLLYREKYRCALTGHIDRASSDKAEQSPELFPDLAPLFASQPPAVTGDLLYDLEVAHIISQSLTDGIGGLTDAARAKLDWASSASAILDRFSGIDVKQLLGGTDLHSAINGFMASNEAHALFDRLDFCLLPAMDSQDQIIPDTYDILYLYRHRNSRILPRVTFTPRVLNGKTIPPPSSVLLGLHAACARIAHMSGAADILDKFDRDIPPTAVLTQGVSNMEADPVAAQDLASALYRLAIVRPVYVY